MNHYIQTSSLNFKQQTSDRISPRYMPGLDGLRALAVLAVFAYHLDLSYVPGGLLGVNLFFVLSGYLITNILLAEQELCGRINLKRFWIRRIRRLLPALFFMLAGVSIWLYAFAPERLISLKQEILAASLYASNWYLIFHEVSYFEQFGPASPLGHLWSLAIEEQFYFVWPILLMVGLWLFPKKKGMVLITVFLVVVSTVLMAMVYVPGQDPSRVYYGTDTRAFALLSGAILAMIWPQWKTSERLHFHEKLTLDGMGIIALAGILWMILKTNQYQSFLYQGGLLLFSVATACLVAVLAHPASVLGKLFGWRPLRWLGECSYGIYLWHYPVITLTNPAINTNGPSLSRSLMQIGLTIVLAVLSRYFVEDPIRYGWKRKVRTVQNHSDHGYRHRRGAGMVTARVSVSMLVIFSILFASTGKSSQTLAIDESDGAVINGKSQSLELVQSSEQEQVQVGEKLQIRKPATTPPKAFVKENVVDLDLISAGPADSAKAGAMDSTERMLEMDEYDGLDEMGNDVLDGNNITVIGDSLMVGVEPFLKDRLPGITIDAKKNRQMREAPEIIANLQSQGELKKIIIVELGTNGPFTEEQLMEMLDILKGAEHVFLINARVPKHWETVVNETLANTAGTLVNITLIDWYLTSSGKDEYFYSDGVHVNAKGANAYCDMIISALSID